MTTKIRCTDCENCKFEQHGGSPARYYCTHTEVTAGVGSVMICRCKRGEMTMRIKSSPTWCPLKLKTSTEIRTCRVCGCTDISPCIGDFGECCYWTKADLCSACDEEEPPFFR